MHLKPFEMANVYLRCEDCAKTFKTFQALLKHYSERHANKQPPKRTPFFEGNEEINLVTPCTLKSPAVIAEYKAWLVGVTERINGIHHQRHKRNWQNVEFNMVPLKFFQQLLKDLGNPQPNAVRSMSHWRPPILKSRARKVIYRLLDISKLKAALEKQNVLSVKEKVFWSGDNEVTEDVTTIEDPREAIAAAKSRAHRQSPTQKITCRSQFVVGGGQSRATRELDVIWWPNLYDSISLGKLVLRLYAHKVELF